jgi:hypothetical protein
LTAKAPSEDSETEQTYRQADQSPTIPEESFPPSNLDPGLLDPEIRNYFFRPDSHDPPPYTDIDQSSQHILPDAPPTAWLHFDDPFDTFVARPLSENDTIDPSLFEPPPFQPAEIYPPHPSNYNEPSISPTALERPAALTPTEPVKWYSGGKEVVSKVPPKRRSREMTREDESVGDISGKQWEVNVETGLNTVKRLKLVFREKTLPSTAEQGKHVESEGNGIQRTIPDERDLAVGDNRDTALPADVTMPRKCRAVSVVIPRRKINRELYPMFLARNARQTMVRSKATGRIKGFIYEWP